MIQSKYNTIKIMVHFIIIILIHYLYALIYVIYSVIGKGRRFLLFSLGYRGGIEEPSANC